MIWVAEGIMVPLAEALVLEAPEELEVPPELLELVGVVPGAVTLMEKAGSALVVLPSLAEMTMLS
jgi:hypothetical protein